MSFLDYTVPLDLILGFFYLFLEKKTEERFLLFIKPVGLRNLATFHILIRSHQLKKTDACCQIPNSTGKTVEFLLIIPKQIMRLVEFSEGLVNCKSTGIQICLRVRSIWFLVTFVTFTNFSVAMSSWIRKCSRNTLVFICFDSKFWGCSGNLFGQGARVN